MRSRGDDAKRAEELAVLIRDDFLDTGCSEGGLGEVVLYPSGTAEFWIDTEETPPVRMLVTVRQQDR